MERNDKELNFIVEWFDKQPQILKRYLLKLFMPASEVEMYDLSTNRRFLKRTKLPSHINGSDFVIGNRVLLFSRDLSIVEYGDNATRKLLATAREKMAMIIMPTSYKQIGNLVNQVELKDLNVTNIKSFSMQKILKLDRATSVLGLVSDKSIYSNGVSEDLAVAVIFEGSNTFDEIKELQEQLHFDNPTADILLSRNSNHAEEIAHILFTSVPMNRMTTAAFDNCTCCLIKPHAVKLRTIGAILDTIPSNEYDISAIQLFHLERAMAAEFYEIYEGLAADFNNMVDELCSGPVIALEIRHKAAVTDTENIVKSFRKVVGPWDVQMAQELFPDSIRGKYGVSSVKNAVHCTDLAEDGVSEVSYFFDVLIGNK